MWHLKLKFIPLVVGVLRTLKNGTKQYLGQVPGFPSLTGIQKIRVTLFEGKHSSSKKTTLVRVQSSSLK